MLCYIQIIPTIQTHNANNNTLRMNHELNMNSIYEWDAHVSDGGVSEKSWIIARIEWSFFIVLNRTNNFLHSDGKKRTKEAPTQKLLYVDECPDFSDMMLMMILIGCIRITHL
ncbi:hypothetical protein ACJX0J_037893, partial [Zea mays]